MSRLALCPADQAQIGRLLTSGEDNFYLEPEWTKATLGAINKGIGATGDYADVHRIVFYHAHWPSLVREKQRFHAATNVNEKKARAVALRRRLTTLTTSLHNLGHSIIVRARERGAIKEAIDPDFAFNLKYKFSNYQMFHIMVSYTELAIILNRMLADVACFFGQDDTALNEENLALCRKIWMSIPYVESFGILAASVSTLYLMMSCTSAGERERSYIIDILLSAAEYFKNLPQDRDAMEEAIDYTIGAAIGRRPFHPTMP